MNAPALEMKSVVKSFDRTPVLNKLDFSLPHGRIVGLLGRNGAGKSTLIECALGLQTINYGEVHLLGESAASLSEATRGRIGYVPQENDLFEWMTATQMLAFFKAFYKRWNDAKVGALLDRWSIPRDTLIKSLSGGEKQRLAIIRALAHEPDLLILDEPVASLDPAGRRDFLRELVDSTLARNTTVLFSTHILTDLERVAVDVAMMKEGKIFLHTELDVLTEEAVRITGSAEAIAQLKLVSLTPQYGGAGVREPVYARVTAKARAEIASDQPNLVVERLSLEDFFIEVTK